MEPLDAFLPAEPVSERAGIHVPGWAIAAITAAVTLLSAGFVYGRAAAERDGHDQLVDYRLCRIEHALNIEPWQTCPEPQQIRGGGPVR